MINLLYFAFCEFSSAVNAGLFNMLIRYRVDVWVSVQSVQF